ncbi:MAG: nucleotidyltransferase domain-containing protein [Candidatus Pacearchaeota archaeon]
MTKKKIRKVHKKSRLKSKKRAFLSPDLKTDKEIAMDFAVKAYGKFDKLIKAIVLFGSTTKETATSTSDIDIIIIIDDASINWDQELIAWYREELGKLAALNRYKKEIHITTTKITTWWGDLMKGDPTIINILRYGEALIDIGGFFNPIKALLLQGRIHSTYEAIFMALQRAPQHFQRSKLSSLNSIEGLFWCMVDSSQAALMAANVMPPSPEHIPLDLKETFVDKGMLKINYVSWFRDLLVLHKRIAHGEIRELKGNEISEWQDKTEEFMRVMAKLVDGLITKNK